MSVGRERLHKLAWSRLTGSVAYVLAPPEAVAPQQHHVLNNTRGFYTPKIADKFLELASGCVDKNGRNHTAPLITQEKKMEKDTSGCDRPRRTFKVVLLGTAGCASPPPKTTLNMKNDLWFVVGGAGWVSRVSWRG